MDNDDPHAVHFTAASLRELFEATLRIKGKGHTPKTENLFRLAGFLNALRAMYWNYNKIWKKEAAGSDGMTELMYQLRALMQWRFERFTAFLSEEVVTEASADFVNRERALYTKFHELELAFSAADVSPTMNIGALAPTYEGWRSIAEMVSTAIQNAMLPSNRPMGLGSDGPISRLVAAIIPKITGDEPSVGNVALCLKKKAKQSKDNS